VLAPGTHQDSNDPIVRSEVRVWDLGHLDRRPKTIQLPWTGYGQAMALGPHGSRVYLSDPVAAYSVLSGKRLWRAHVASTWLPLDLSPDGRHLAVVPNDTGLDIALISTRHGRVERVLQGASGIVLDLTFSDDGSQVAAVSQADELLMWNRHSAHPTQTIAIDDSEGVQLNPDASRAYVSDSGEGTVVTWDLDGSASYLPLTSSHPGLVTTQVGFGLPAGRLTGGSATQSGTLPEKLTCTLGARPAAASIALVSPGLYQINLTVPSDAPLGDNPLTCVYGLFSTKDGAILTVR